MRSCHWAATHSSPPASAARGPRWRNRERFVTRSLVASVTALHAGCLCAVSLLWRLENMRMCTAALAGVVRIEAFEHSGFRTSI